MLNLDVTNIKSYTQQIQKLVARQFEYLNTIIREENLTIKDNAKLSQDLATICIASDYIPRILQQYPQILKELLNQRNFNQKITQALLKKQFKTIAYSNNKNEFKKQLRVFRHNQHLKIAWRSIIGISSLQETILEQSIVADFIIQQSLEWLYKHLDSSPEQRRLVIIGLGKLGGEELNFSSDVDLIFTYPDEPEENNKIDITIFYKELSQHLIDILADVTEDGFVYRVDARLRPFGNSGPLVLSFAMMENYYQQHGREWERYALIKARTITGKTKDCINIMGLLRPFIYRRYIDFSVFESLRDMKSLIEQEVLLTSKEDNIKIGAGGIRQIEFIAQAFQLVHGGKNPIFQQRSIFIILELLGNKKIIAKSLCNKLKDAYIFLRQLENALQMLRDQQNHTLPTINLDKTRIATHLQFNSWEECEVQLNKHRKIVEMLFAVISTDGQELNTPEQENLSQLKTLWQDNIPFEQSENIITQLNYQDPKNIYKIINNFRESNLYNKISLRGKKRLKKLVPLIIQNATNTKNPTLALERFLKLLETIGKRSSYLALMLENQNIVSYILELLTKSKWIFEQLCNYPILLDELLQSKNTLLQITYKNLQTELNNRLRWFNFEDLEQQMESLRQFKLDNILKIAIADITQNLTLKRVSDYLSTVAEVILDRVVAIAWQQLTFRYGFPIPNIDSSLDSNFVIIGYGKLGGIELSYSSDLDLVFLHTKISPQEQTNGPKKIPSSEFYIRLGQRIYHMLNTTTLNGKLYDIDMRLRPLGESGLLVTSIDAFANYQKKDAWTFEHQALVRSRVVAGDRKLEYKFNSLRQEILALKRESYALKNDILEMRNKMLTLKPKNHIAEALTAWQKIQDIEFIVQYLVLKWAHDKPLIMQYTDNLRILDNMLALDILTQKQVTNLKDAFLYLRHLLHYKALHSELPSITSEYEQHINNIKNIWNEIFN